MDFEKQQLNSLEEENSADALREVERLFKETTVYINAGGRGTRLEPVLPKDKKGIAKAMIEFNEQPMIKNHTDLLLKLNFKNIIVGAGDHTNIADYYSENDIDDERLDIVDTATQEDTGGDLIKAVRQVENVGKNVLIENVDTVLYVDRLDSLLAQHEQSGATATIVLTTAKGVPNENAFFVDESGKVVYTKEGSSDEQEEPKEWSGFRGSSTGMVIIDSNFIKSYDWSPGDSRLSVYRDMVPELIKRGLLFAYNNGDSLFADIGTPEKYKKFKRHEKQLFNALGDKYLNN
ncbi:MAG: nucleotidyltransferase family protein [Candidatus Komeilibacteria bacterium]